MLQLALSSPGCGARWDRSGVRTSGAAAHPDSSQARCSHGRTSGRMLTVLSRFSLQDAGIGFILVIDRRQDRWTSVKASILRIAVSVGVRPATPTPSPGGGHGLSCLVALWVLAGAACVVGPKAEVGASWGLGRTRAHLPGLLELLGTCVCARTHVCMCVQVCVCIVHACTSMHVCACMYKCVHARVHVYMHACVFSQGLTLRGRVIT